MSRAVANDIGTMFFQTAEKNADGTVKFQCIRNAFVEMAGGEDTEDTLKRNGWNYVKDGEKYFVTGEDAIRVARAFPNKVELRRPLADGVLNKGEDKKTLVLDYIIESTVGQAPDDKSLVCFCVSSPSVDGSQDSQFHKMRLGAMFTSRGWKVKVIEEAFAVILSERPSVTEKIDGVDQEAPYSGIGISCLLPGTKIYTKNGIKNIEDIKIGDEVLTHLGRWRSVYNINVKHFEGISTHLQLAGYENSTNAYGFVDNHELYVKRDGKWAWIGCEEVVEGDRVGEPVCRRNDELGIPAISVYEHTTCSNKYSKTRIECSSDVQRLMGYFMGDGSVNRKKNNGINFRFGLHEVEYVRDVQEILKKNFKKNSKVYVVDNTLRVECYSKGLSNWFRNHCYNDRIKVYPWAISRLSRGQCLNLLVGLIRSDGWNNEYGVGFGNTSSQLAMTVKQLFSRLGYAASLSRCDPRTSTLSCGRKITGKKENWYVHCGNKFVFSSLSSFVEGINCDNSKLIEKISVDDGFCTSAIQKIDHRDYSGNVYDLQVEEDHSFSGPFLTIHNCGAGRTNCVLAYKGVQVIGMSVSRGGDWIDKQVVDATGLPLAQITSYKEKTLDFDNLGDSDVAAALDVYYGEMIRYVFSLFGKKFQEVKSEFDAPLDVVIAGGTSMPKGFIEKTKHVIKGLSLPFKVKDIRHARDPRNAVVEGCLAQAIVSQGRLEKGVDI